MKKDFFKNIKDNLKGAFTFQDEDDYYDDEYLDEEEGYEEEPEPQAAPKAQPKSAPAGTPNYAPYGGNQFRASAYQPYGADTGDAAKAKKSAGNIYNMNNAKPAQKLKVALFLLEDMNDARNVADCMIDRGVVTICDLSKIDGKEERRVLDFLDGVKYVCNSKIENISDHIYLVVPEAAELSGDFFSQVDPTPFYG